MSCQWRNLSSLHFSSSCTSRVELSWHLTQNPDASMRYAPWLSPADNPRVFFACLKLNSAKDVSAILIPIISGMWEMNAGVPVLKNIDLMQHVKGVAKEAENPFLYILCPIFS